MTQLSVADVLERAADLIEPKGAWTQHASARRSDGMICLFDDPKSVCFCALGAIFHEGGGPVDADNFFGDFLSPGSRWTAITRFNDAQGRTQAEVVAKLHEAAALARTQPTTKGE